jgi:hypothetical protein
MLQPQACQLVAKYTTKHLPAVPAYRYCELPAVTQAATCHHYSSSWLPVARCMPAQQLLLLL